MEVEGERVRERFGSRDDHASFHRTPAFRPGEVCRQLLRAMEAAEGRRARRKRNTTPDALGMEIKRGLLEAVIADDPAPDEFEEWLFARVHDAGDQVGATRAMLRQVWDEWQFAAASGGFREWLAAGAPSDDARGGERGE